MEDDSNGFDAGAMLLYALIALGGNLIQNAGNKERTAEANAFNERMAAEAYERQQEFYSQHETVGAKVQEAQQAGVNPAALYGNLGASSAPSVQSASASSPIPFVIDLLSLFTNTIMKGKELDIQKMIGESQVKKNEADIAKTEAETKTIDLERDFLPALRSGQVSQISETINLLKAQVNTEETKQLLNESGVTKNMADAALTLLQYEIEEVSKDSKISLADALSRSAQANATMDEAKAKYANEYARAELNEITSQAFLNSANARQVREFCIQNFETKDQRGRSLFQNLTNAQIVELQSCIRLNDNRSTLTWKQGKEVDATIEKIAAETGYTKKEIQWYTYHAFCDGLESVADVVSACVPQIRISESTTTKTKTGSTTRTRTRSSK